MKDIRSVTAMSGHNNISWSNEEPSAGLSRSPDREDIHNVMGREDIHNVMGREDIHNAMLQLRSLGGSTGLSIMDWTERLIELTSVADDQLTSVSDDQLTSVSDEQLTRNTTGQTCDVNTSIFPILEHSKRLREHSPSRPTFQQGKHLAETSQTHNRHLADTLHAQISSRNLKQTRNETSRRQRVSTPPSAPSEGVTHNNLFNGDSRVTPLDRSCGLPSCQYLGKQVLSLPEAIQSPTSEPPMSDFSSFMSVTSYTSHDATTHYSTHGSTNNNTPHITQENLEQFGGQTASKNFNLFYSPLSVDLNLNKRKFSLGTMDGLNSLTSAVLITNSPEQPDSTGELHGNLLSPLSCSRNVSQFTDDFIDFATVEVQTTDVSQQTSANVSGSSPYSGTFTICQAEDTISNTSSTNSSHFKLPSCEASGRTASLATTNEQLTLNASLARTISSGISLPDDIEQHLVTSRSDPPSPWERFSVSIHPWDSGVLSLTDEDLPVEENIQQIRPQQTLDLQTPTDIPRDALRKSIDISLGLTPRVSVYQRPSHRLHRTAQRTDEAAVITDEAVPLLPHSSKFTRSCGLVSMASPSAQSQTRQPTSCVTSSVAYAVPVSSLINVTNFQTTQTCPEILNPASHSSQQRILSDPESSLGEPASGKEQHLFIHRQQTLASLNTHRLSNQTSDVTNPRLSSYRQPNLSDLSSDALLSPGDVNRAFLGGLELQTSGQYQAPIGGTSSEMSDVSMLDSDASSSVSTSLAEGDGSGERTAAQNLKEKLRFRLKVKGLAIEGLKPTGEVRTPDTGSHVGLGSSRNLDSGLTSGLGSSQLTSLTRGKRYSDDTDSSSASRAKNSRRSSSSTLSGSSEDDHDVISDSQNDKKGSNKRSERKDGATGGGDDVEEDEERIAKREKNRLAAQKCRHMKRDKMVMLSKQVYRLEERQDKIRSEVERLNEEREQLEEMLRVHAFICKRQQHPLGQHNEHQHKDI